MDDTAQAASVQEQVDQFRKDCGGLSIGGSLAEAHDCLQGSIEEWREELRSGCSPHAFAEISRREALLARCSLLLEEVKQEAYRRTQPDWRPLWSIPEDSYAV